MKKEKTCKYNGINKKCSAAFDLIINLLLLTVAGCINAVGITMFLSPVKLYDSGISSTI